MNNVTEEWVCSEHQTQHEHDVVVRPTLIVMVQSLNSQEGILYFLNDMMYCLISECF